MRLLEEGWHSYPGAARPFGASPGRPLSTRSWARSLARSAKLCCPPTGLRTQVWEVESPGFELLQPSSCVVLGRALHLCVCVWMGKLTRAKGQGLGVAAVPG